MDKLLIKIFKRGVSKKSTWLGRGVSQKSMLGPQGGGGSKSPENWSTWFMNDPLGDEEEISKGFRYTYIDYFCDSSMCHSLKPLRCNISKS